MACKQQRYLLYQDRERNPKPGEDEKPVLYSPSVGKKQDRPSDFTQVIHLGVTEVRKRGSRLLENRYV
jgi:hypothetical protein